MSVSLFLAYDLWVFPVSGCVSVRIHTAASQSAPGPDQTADTALLWPQVTHTSQSMHKYQFQEMGLSLDSERILII